jgi:2-polyprenyl-3-methyl-5-hydroxy-6-metoxy-1,4-benzoquinol methylase
LTIHSSSRAQRDVAQQIFDSYAATYKEKFNQNPLAKYQREVVHQEIMPYLKSVKKILDVGCGPGSDFDFYKSLDLEVDAIDLSPKMAELARDKSSRIHLKANIQASSLEEFQSTEQYQTIILNFGVINSFQHLEPVLKKLQTLVAQRGILVIVSMPPFHFFSIKGLAVGFHFKRILDRLFRSKAVLEKGFTLHYYRKKDFLRYFDILRKINLCALLPTPDQYYRWNWLRLYSKIMMALDRKVSTFVPDFFGGDHICYIMQTKN